MSRNIPTAAVLEIAAGLVSHEASVPQRSGTNSVAAFRVVEKLGRPISSLAGLAGFRTLVARALMLAKSHTPELGAVRVNPDGSLDGCALGTEGRVADAGVMLLAQLLGLLFTFIGQPLTMSLVRDVWRDLPALDNLTVKKK